MGRFGDFVTRVAAEVHGRIVRVKSPKARPATDADMQEVNDALRQQLRQGPLKTIDLGLGDDDPAAQPDGGDVPGKFTELRPSQGRVNSDDGKTPGRA